MHCHIGIPTAHTTVQLCTKWHIPCTHYGATLYNVAKLQWYAYAILLVYLRYMFGMQYATTLLPMVVAHTAQVSGWQRCKPRPQIQRHTVPPCNYALHVAHMPTHVCNSRSTYSFCALGLPPTVKPNTHTTRGRLNMVVVTNAGNAAVHVAQVASLNRVLNG